MSMKALRAFSTAAILLLVATAASGAPDQLNWGNEVNPGQCDTAGKPLVSITQQVVNGVDSGIAGNYWAFDHYSRQIQVWPQSDGSYCAIVRYQGHFDGQAGQTSPGATGTLFGDEDGTFEGGYRAIINGTPKADPAWRTRGFVGVNDYQCDILGNCPGLVNWVDQYFESGYSFAFDWWGWIYHGGQHGTWVNSSDGNSGEIL